MMKHKVNNVETALAHLGYVQDEGDCQFWKDPETGNAVALRNWFSDSMVIVDGHIQHLVATEYALALYILGSMILNHGLTEDVRESYDLLLQTLRQIPLDPKATLWE